MSLLINKSILVTINLLIIFYIILLIIDHISANNKITSWSSIFNILSLIFLSIRGFFWLLTMYSTTSWDIFTFYVLYWIPNPIEFSSFMLLPLFFVQIIYPSLWEDYWSYLRPIYITIIIGLVCFQVIWALFVAYEESLVIECSRKSHHFVNRSQCFHTDYSSDVFRLITAFSFLLLASLQAAYAYKIHYMESSQYSRFMISSRNTIAFVNCVLFVSFVSRALYQFGTMLDLFHLPNIPLQGDEDVDYKIVICFTVWDYLPTILLITTITSRVIGDNRYYANSILQLGKQINHYSSKTKSDDKRRRAIRGRSRGISSFLPNQNLMCLQPIDEENPLIQLTNYGTINPIDREVNESTNNSTDSQIDKEIDQSANKSYSNILKSSNNDIDKISSDSLKSFNKPFDKLLNKLSNSSISYPNTLLSNQFRILYNNSNSLDSKISKDSLINNKNSKESLIELDYDYYDDDIDRCSMDRFDPPSLSALNGVLYITDPIEDPSIQYANNLQQSLSVSLESTNDSINQINKSNSFSIVQSKLNSPIKPSNSNTSLTQVLTYYKRRRGSSIGSDTTTVPSTSPRVNSSFISNLNIQSKLIKSNSNIKLSSEKEDKEKSKPSNNISNQNSNPRIISSHIYRNSPNHQSNSSTILKEDDYKSAIARPLPIGGSKKPFHMNSKSNLMKNYSIDNLDTIRSENPPPDGSTN